MYTKETASHLKEKITMTVDKYLVGENLKT